MSPSPEMLSYAEALAIVLRAAPRPRREEAPIGVALGRVLAADVRADRDLPPFDRAALDGYAVRVDGDFGVRQVLPIVAEIAAGESGPRLLPRNTCVRIWTGAPVPGGANGIVPVERAREEEGRAVLDGPLQAVNGRRPGIAARAEDARRGSIVLERGRLIAAADLAVLASVGCATVPVAGQPRLAVVETGHELVAAGRRPLPSQIRASNGFVVRAVAAAAGAGEIRSLGIVEDRPSDLRRALGRGLGSDVLVVTGGVSAGRLDLVPGILRDLGVRVRLHRVAIRPGKPFLFGVRAREGRRCFVFGLPGNPVSVLATSVVFLAPFLRAWRGEPSPGDRSLAVRLEAPLRRGGGLVHFVPARLRADREGRLTAREIPMNGSGDFVAAARAHAFVRIPGDGAVREAGTVVAAEPMPGFRPDPPMEEP